MGGWWVYVPMEDYWAAGPYDSDQEAQDVKDRLYSDPTFGRAVVKQRTGGG